MSVRLIDPVTRRCVREPRSSITDPDGGDRSDWRSRAACRSRDPELFFPIGTTGPAVLQAKEAREICRSCGVSAACLAWAVEAGVEFGIWGGSSEDERREWRRVGNHRRGPRRAQRPSR